MLKSKGCKSCQDSVKHKSALCLQCSHAIGEEHVQMDYDIVFLKLRSSEYRKIKDLCFSKSLAPQFCHSMLLSSDHEECLQSAGKLLPEARYRPPPAEGGEATEHSQFPFEAAPTQDPAKSTQAAGIHLCMM